jgi:RNA polymerase sigma-54 factor
MAAPRFVHLRVRSEYSISDSIVRIDPLIDAAVADGQGALALTDSANLFAWIKFYRAARSGGGPGTQLTYIKRKINAAQWLIEAIEQRRSTLLKTAQAIVDHQIRFLTEGPEAIEPLKMQQIADRIGMHVTTVSRAVDDKWLQTPRGLYPLRRFFVGGTVSADGDEVAVLTPVSGG